MNVTNNLKLHVVFVADRLADAPLQKPIFVTANEVPLVIAQFKRDLQNPQNPLSLSPQDYVLSISPLLDFNSSALGVDFDSAVDGVNFVKESN